MSTGAEKEWLQRFAEALARRTGIEHREHQRQRLHFALQRRMQARGVSSYAEYWELLEQDPSEWQRLTDLVTVTETWFYRHPAFYQALSRHLLPQLHATRPADRPIQLWSTATATGEEAYTLAMAALESHVPAERPVTVVGSDINQEALARARQGLYDARAARQLPRRWKERYLVHHPDGRVEPTAAVRALVRFVLYNLLDLTRGIPPPVSPDVVMCTNVLMYFPERVGRAILRQLHRVLPPDGVLYVDEVVGYLAREIFTPERVDAVIIYRPHLPTRTPPSRRRSMPSRPSPSSSSAQRSSTPDIERALHAFQTGHLDEAEAHLIRWLNRHPLDFRAYFWLGRIHQLREAWAQARQAYERALYLEPTLAAAYLELGNIWRRLGDPMRARRMYQQALRHAAHDPHSAALGYPRSLIRRVSERALATLPTEDPSTAT